MNNARSESVSAAATGETATPTWDQMVQEHGQRVFRLAYRLTGNRQDAEDLSQEAFVRAFKALENYTPGTMGGWLHRITTNLFLDQARRKSKIRFDRFAEGSEDRMPGTAVTPERYFEFNNLDVDVQEALRALSPEFRAAIVLCDMEGFSYEEVSRILDVKLGTVRSRIHRGRAMLRDALAHRNPANRPAKTMSLPRIPRGLRAAS
ncbi:MULTISPECIES: RNA polymerase sigma factor SigE [Glutamicibacter]|uniref:RNA polymerase sigma-70 factor (ECF subfamily) n=2 Tax=Glutamicibacter TaxID=1742989 RepID=A0ABX4N1H3_9MICC|nr:MULTISPECIES: RNA polymerase sigma factor SigE [Glutamicibacter]KWR73109.1 RNA polymerase subunit sigma [Arthrobacter sp. W1]MDV2976495.1 RNA polymerase sigma factor SigE [Actinomycetes bacterium ARC8]MBM7768963.1 RNA polymerase sigma-70 factor (ECF subfamily) [Glutamicibacter nicotianae]PJJ44331.1 RNA polymerase sigma-70 factor (ECF subfamily) [Glutamicibacter mysorens]QEP07681.1 RNA polymerase sigma factor SigE [Glutamicibacter sp. ZJUTW]